MRLVQVFSVCFVIGLGLLAGCEDAPSDATTDPEETGGHGGADSGEGRGGGDSSSGTESPGSGGESGDGNLDSPLKASRTDCASPCAVVFSAEALPFPSMNEHEVFGRELAFHWDFDTDETDTYGSLYEQSYTYVSGDTAYETGHAPLVTKTFLCAPDETCTYNVGVRAQNAEGEFLDAFKTITVRGEAVEWSAANTICVSNTLDEAADWSSFDKACPAGAAKQNVSPDADQYDGKLVLFKRGDVFEQNIAQWGNQSNFKVGNFGDASDPVPEIDGTIYIGLHGMGEPTNAPISIYSFASDDTVAEYGWPENIYIEGIKTGSISTPMSFEHITLHDIDMDRESYDTGGSIAVSRGREQCFWNPDVLACSNVPFAKGLYVSKVNIVGSLAAESNSLAVNIVGIGCEMTNYFGITDSQIRKVGEHNIRLMGFSRLNIMRSKFRGQHYSGGKQKLTIRPCASSATAATLKRGGWMTDEDVDFDVMNSDIGDPTDPANLSVEGGVVDGKVTRAVAVVRPGNGDYVHTSRYQVVHGNQIGDASAPVGTRVGSTKYQTNAVDGDGGIVDHVVLSENTFENDAGSTTGDYGGEASHATCVGNHYTGDWSKNCLAPDPLAGDPESGYDPPLIDFISDVGKPGSQ